MLVDCSDVADCRVKCLAYHRAEAIFCTVQVAIGNSQCAFAKVDTQAPEVIKIVLEMDA